GYSNTDGVTSGSSMNVLFSLSASATQVTVAQVSFGSEVILATLTNVPAGPVVVPVVLTASGNLSLKVVAIGANGGSAQAVKNLYVDPIPLTASWLTPNGQSIESQYEEVQLAFSSRLLAPLAAQSAVSITLDGLPLSAAGLGLVV